MAIDTSIYGLLKPVEMPSMMESQGNAMKLSQIAMQNQGMANDQAAKMRQQKMSALGNALDSLAGLSPQERATQYPQVVGSLKQSGILGANDAPDQYDDGFFRQSYSMYQKSKEGLENQEAATRIAHAKNQDDLLTKRYDFDVKKHKDDTALEYAKLGQKNAIEKLPTKDQFAAATFGTRANQAEDVFSNLAKAGFDPTSISSVAQSKLPGIFEGFKSEHVKQQDQAQRNFVNAILRRESGAAISDSEFDSAKKQYFPMHGDSKEVLQQKEANRKTAIAALNAEGAPALGRVNESLQGMAMGTSIPSTPRNSKGEIISEAKASTIPKHGTVEDGFVFMGGDPSNPKNWKRAK